MPLTLHSKKPEFPRDKDLLFLGLHTTIEFLCKLDNIPNVMDYSKLFEFENDVPKYKLPEFV